MISLGTEGFRILEGRPGKKETMEERITAMLEYFNPVEFVSRKKDRLFMIQQGGDDVEMYASWVRDAEREYGFKGMESEIIKYWFICNLNYRALKDRMLEEQFLSIEIAEARPIELIRTMRSATTGLERGARPTMMMKQDKSMTSYKPPMLRPRAFRPGPGPIPMRTGGYRPSRTFEASRGAYRGAAEPLPTMESRTDVRTVMPYTDKGRNADAEENICCQCNELGHYGRCCLERMTMLKSEDSKRNRTEKMMRSYRFRIINCKEVRFLADKGADTSTMQLKTVEALGLKETMRKSKTVLKPFGNATIQTVGILKTMLEMGGDSFPLISWSSRKDWRLGEIRC